VTTYGVKISLGPTKSQQSRARGVINILPSLNLFLGPSKNADIDRIAVGIEHAGKCRKIRPDHEAKSIRPRLSFQRYRAIQNIRMRANGGAFGKGLGCKLVADGVEVGRVDGHGVLPRTSSALF